MTALTGESFNLTPNFTRAALLWLSPTMNEMIFLVPDNPLYQPQAAFAAAKVAIKSAVPTLI